MTRIGAGAGERIEVAPANNVYTVLAGVGCIVVILAIIVLVARANELMGAGALMK